MALCPKRDTAQEMYYYCVLMCKVDMAGRKHCLKLYQHHVRIVLTSDIANMTRYGSYSKQKKLLFGKRNRSYLIAIWQIKLWLCSNSHSLTAWLFFLHMMTVVFRGQMCGQSVMLSHSTHRNSLAEWPVERREHCDQDMAHSTPPVPTYISH